MLLGDAFLEAGDEEVLRQLLADEDQDRSLLVALRPGLADVAEKFCGPYAHVTTRANLQLREIEPKNATNVIDKAELQGWKKIGQALSDQWVADMNAKGANGTQLLASARALIAKHSGGR